MQGLGEESLGLRAFATFCYISATVFWCVLTVLYFLLALPILMISAIVNPMPRDW